MKIGESRLEELILLCSVMWLLATLNSTSSIVLFSPGCFSLKVDIFLSVCVNQLELYWEAVVVEDHPLAY